MGLGKTIQTIAFLFSLVKEVSELVWREGGRERGRKEGGRVRRERERWREREEEGG